MHCVVGTAGHIDHGKTALVKALTGVDTDRLKEEKKRGLSIDLGFASMDLGGGMSLSIVDVPGHERFIKNMLAGVSGVDVVVFVVAGDDGVMPQTREHLDIVHLLGIKKGVFVITKADLVGSERIKEVAGEINSLLKGTILEGSPVVVVSSVRGDGLDELKDTLRTICCRIGDEPARGFFRLPVDRAFHVRGFGTVVTGTVTSGSIGKGEEVAIYPAGCLTRIRGMQSAHEDIDRAGRGQRVALNLAGISHEEVGRGDVVVCPELFEFSGRRTFTGRCTSDCIIHLLPSMERPLRNNTLLKLHHLTSETLARIRLMDRKDAQPGESVYARIYPHAPLLMLRGDRFILRDPSVNRTIGGGEVLLTHPSEKPRQGTGRAGLRIPSGREPEEVLSGIIPQGSTGIRRSLLGFMLNMRDDELMDYIKDGSTFTVMGGYVVNLRELNGIKDDIIRRVRSHHEKNPGEVGMGEEMVLCGVVPSVDRGIVRCVLDRMIEEGRLKREGSLIALPDHRPTLDEGTRMIRDSILNLFSGGMKAVRMDDIRGLPYSEGDVKRVMEFLRRHGDVVKIKDGLFVSGRALERARGLLTDYLDRKGRIKASEFRDLLGCGRKLAIEILEYFDGTRLTIRQGDFRVLRKGGKVCG